MKKISLLVCGLFLIAMAFLVVPVMGAATQIAVNAGNGQSATVDTAVTTLPGVIVQDANNTPVSGVSVTFAVATGGGSVTGASATTDANGIATVSSWTLGTTAGSNTLTATSESLTGSPVTFTATGTAGAATQIAMNAGNGQSATVGTAVTILPSVIVQDANNNPVSGESVTFAVATGGGSVTTGASATTNANGIATVISWTLGPTAGSNTLMATSGSLSGSPVTFTATGTVVSIPSYGNISVSSTPSGANVYLDNVYMGLTTLPMEEIANGNHVVIVKLAGYQDWTQTVTVLGNSTSLTATLVANTTTVVNGSISFTSSPTNANVYINSVLKGYTPITVYNITPASYTVTVQKPGYLIYANRFDVTSGNTTTVSVTLTVEPTATSTLSATAPITTATTTTPTKKSTAKTYTPWPTNTPTTQSPVPLEICIGAIGIGMVLLKRRG
ncbi:MAG: PEGA domain-containing protein [Methanoregula sp.]|jgi:adhesin/invasin